MPQSASDTMKVLLFGPAAKAVNSRHAEVRVSLPTTAGAVLQALASQRPEITFALPGSRLAVNHAFAAADAVIHPGDELALIAMVSGG
jgi:molybdopterin converting factor small subunit